MWELTHVIDLFIFTMGTHNIDQKMLTSKAAISAGFNRFFILKIEFHDLVENFFCL